jgi:hypothetical protein
MSYAFAAGNDFAKDDGSKVISFITSRDVTLINMAEPTNYQVMRGIGTPPKDEGNDSLMLAFGDGKTRDSTTEHDNDILRWICSLKVDIDGIAVVGMDRKDGGKWHDEFALCLPKTAITRLSVEVRSPPYVTGHDPYLVTHYGKVVKTIAVSSVNKTGLLDVMKGGSHRYRGYPMGGPLPPWGQPAGPLDVSKQSDDWMTVAPWSTAIAAAQH